jgi:hypothetical protein
MIRNYKHNQLQLYALTENKLVFKEKMMSKTTKYSNPLSFSNPAKKITSPEHKNLSDPKSLLQKRLEIKIRLESKEALTRKKPAKQSLEVIGKSESNENIKNSTRLRSVSLHKFNLHQNAKPVVNKITLLACKTDYNNKIFPDSSSRQKGVRRIVPISNSCFDVSDIEDVEDFIIINSRYF